MTEGKQKRKPRQGKRRHGQSKLPQFSKTIVVAEDFDPRTRDRKIQIMIWTKRLGVALLSQLEDKARESRLFGRTAKTPAGADVRNQLRRLVPAKLLKHPSGIGDGKYELTKRGEDLLHAYLNKKVTA